MNILGEDTENCSARVTRHCNVSHLFGARNKILMERWLRLKAMCGFGFVCSVNRHALTMNYIHATIYPCHWGGWQQ